MRLSLVGPGAAALTDTDLVLPARPRRSWFRIKPQWDIGSLAFHPPVAGRYTVRLIPLHPGIRRLDVKVVETPGVK